MFLYVFILSTISSPWKSTNVSYHQNKTPKENLSDIFRLVILRIWNRKQTTLLAPLYISPFDWWTFSAIFSYHKTHIGWSEGEGSVKGRGWGVKLLESWRDQDRLIFVCPFTYFMSQSCNPFISTLDPLFAGQKAGKSCLGIANVQELKMSMGKTSFFFFFLHLILFSYPSWKTRAMWKPVRVLRKEWGRLACAEGQ